MSSCFLSGDAPLIYGSDSVVDMDDLDRTFNDGWFELIWFSNLSHFWCHIGAYSLFRSRFVDPPLICMITLDFEIHIKLMIRFNCVMILRGASLESFSQIHVFWYSHDSWTKLSQARGFLGHHFSRVHLRSFVHPHGIILDLSGPTRYVWCYTGAYFSHSAAETIVLSQICYSFSSLGRDIVFALLVTIPVFFLSRRVFNGAWHSDYSLETLSDYSFQMTMDSDSMVFWVRGVWLIMTSRQASWSSWMGYETMFAVDLIILTC